MLSRSMLKVHATVSFTRVYHIEDLVAPRFRQVRERQRPTLQSGWGEMGSKGSEGERCEHHVWATPAPPCVLATPRTSPSQDAAPPTPLPLHGAGLLCWLLGLGSWVGKGSPQLPPGLGGCNSPGAVGWDPRSTLLDTGRWQGSWATVRGLHG